MPRLHCKWDASRRNALVARQSSTSGQTTEGRLGTIDSKCHAHAAHRNRLACSCAMLWRRRQSMPYRVRPMPDGLDAPAHCQAERWYDTFDARVALPRNERTDCQRCRPCSELHRSCDAGVWRSISALVERSQAASAEAATTRQQSPKLRARLHHRRTGRTWLPLAGTTTVGDLFVFGDIRDAAARRNARRGDGARKAD